MLSVLVLRKVPFLTIITIVIITFQNNNNCLVNAYFSGAVILPHGDVAFDPTLIPESTMPVERLIASRIAHASRQAAQWFRQDLNPDVIFLTTPHGIALDTNYGLYMSPKAEGTVTIEPDLFVTERDIQKKSYNVSMSINLDANLSTNLLQKLSKEMASQDNGKIVSGIYSFNDQSSLPLQWGEIIPLAMIYNNTSAATKQQQLSKLQRLLKQSKSRMLLKKQKYESSSGTKSNKQNDHSTDDYYNNTSNTSLNDNNDNGDLNIPNVLIWTFPHTRYKHAPEMIPDLLRLGSEIRDWIERLVDDVSVGVVISGDLSHTHDPNGPYGYSNSSAPMDHALEQWISGNPCHNADYLLRQAASYQNNAKSCGFTGMVLLHGMLCNSTNHDNDSGIFKGTVLVNHNVTYYGMMAATIGRK